MNLTEFFLRCTQLGAEWVMWVLVALSILNVAVICERCAYFFTHRIRFGRFVAQLEKLVREGDLKEAMSICKRSRAPEAVVAAAGLGYFKTNAEKMSEAMLSAKATVRLKLESYLSILATLGSNAPFIGLFGTVLGIIRASQDLSRAQQAQEEVSSAVMSGVFEALVATAVGLFVAIPAVIAYNWLLRKVRVRLGRVDAVAHLLLALHPHRVATSKAPPPVSGTRDSIAESEAPPKVGVSSRVK